MRNNSVVQTAACVETFASLGHEIRLLFEERGLSLMRLRDSGVHWVDWCVTHHKSAQ